MTNLWIVILLLCSASDALAECGTYYCDYARVLGVTTAADGSVFVQVSGATANLNCTLHGGSYLTLQRSGLGFKEMYASILAHQMTDKPLMFRINEGSSGCTINYIYATAS